MKLKIANVIVTGLLLGAGAVHAAGTAFPTSANEVTPSLYADTIKTETLRAGGGATQPVFPNAAREHAAALDFYRSVRSAGTSPSIAGGAASVFPSSAIEIL